MAFTILSSTNLIKCFGHPAEKSYSVLMLLVQYSLLNQQFLQLKGNDIELRHQTLIKTSHTHTNKYKESYLQLFVFKKKSKTISQTWRCCNRIPYFHKFWSCLPSSGKIYEQFIWEWILIFFTFVFQVSFNNYLNHIIKWYILKISDSINLGF